MKRLLILVDESNLLSAVRQHERNLDWNKLRDFLTKAVDDAELQEMVVYSAMPPAMQEWQNERDKKSKFFHWLRSNGFLVVTREGSPGEEGHYKGNVDVMMTVDAIELVNTIKPDVIILVTGDSDFASLALYFRRNGIRVEVASSSQVLGAGIKTATNAIIDLDPLIKKLEKRQDV